MPQDSEDIKRSIVAHLHQLGRRLRKQAAGNLGAENLTMHQLQALFFVKHGQPVRMSELARDLSISPGSATLIADRLVEAGWLVRTPDPDDRRSIYLQLSAPAQKKLDKIHTRRMAQAGQILDKLGASDLRELDRLLGLLHDTSEGGPHS